MLRRWNILLALVSQPLGATFALQAQQPGGVSTSRQIVDYWVGRLLGRSVPDASYQHLLDFMRQGQPADAPPTGTDVAVRINNLAALIAMTPEFQER
jgi:hypothetical protein